MPGRHVEAERDASLAVDITLSFSESERPLDLLSKLYSRKAKAQMAAGKKVPALKTYMEGLAVCHRSEQLSAAARLALDSMPVSWVAEYWSIKVDSAQKPNVLSSRDGFLLRPVPTHRRLSPGAARSHLEIALENDDELQEETKNLICSCWIQGKTPRRPETAFIRGVIYLHAGDPEQAEKDATMALVYGPQADGRESAWPAALLLRSSALEARGFNVPAVLDAARAAEINPESIHATDALERLLRRIPEHYAESIRNGGSAALEALLKVEKERSLPEILRPRPKYYYYYEWMRRRIETRHPELPDAIMDKLLTMEATELDLLLQYPAAVDRTIEEMVTVLEERGQEALIEHAVPLLSWEQVQELQVGNENLSIEGMDGLNDIQKTCMGDGDDPELPVLEAHQHEVEHQALTRC